MSARTINNPSDIESYSDSRVVYRSGSAVKGGPRVVEAAWHGTADHPAEKVSFLSDGQGGWEKSDTLRMGDVEVREYVSPVVSGTEGRDLTWGEFLEVGAKVSLLKFNAVLGAFPIAVQLGQRYVSNPGIKFEDAATPGTLLGDLIGGAVAANIIDENDVAAVIAKWVEIYPKVSLP